MQVLFGKKTWKHLTFISCTHYLHVIILTGRCIFHGKACKCDLHWSPLDPLGSQYGSHTLMQPVTVAKRIPWTLECPASTRKCFATGFYKTYDMIFCEMIVMWCDVVCCSVLCCGMVWYDMWYGIYIVRIMHKVCFFSLLSCSLVPTNLPLFFNYNTGIWAMIWSPQCQRIANKDVDTCTSMYFVIIGSDDARCQASNISNADFQSNHQEQTLVKSEPMNDIVHSRKCVYKSVVCKMTTIASRPRCFIIITLRPSDAYIRQWTN